MSKSPDAVPSGRTTPTPNHHHHHHHHQPAEKSLQRLLKVRLSRLKSREPLDPVYRLVGPGGRQPSVPRDRLYRKMGAELRHRVESFTGRGGDTDANMGRGKWGMQRDVLEEDKMRAAFTLRECKKHEQEAFVAASLAVGPIGRRLPFGWDEMTRRRRLEGIALGLQEKEKKKKRQKAELAKLKAAARAAEERQKKQGEKEAKALALDEKKIRQKEKEALAKAEEALLRKQEERGREIEERERIRSIERQKQRERDRELFIKRQEEEARKKAEREKEEALRRARMAETPQQALHRLYQPIFRILWDMEFANLHGTNPFRIVIDSSNCAAMGVPDYCDVIKRPMNLSYIQEKVENRSYVTLQEFFADVDLMISNALLYNSDPKNEFHIAAREMKKKYKKMVKKVIHSVNQQLKKK